MRETFAATNSTTTKRIMKYLKFLVLLIIISKNNPSAAQEPEKKSIDSLMNLFAKNHCFNGDMRITVNDKIFYESSYGYRNNETKEKLVHNSIFNIGSISKPFTSVCILQLQEKKKLNIEDNVKKYIPEFPYDNICIKHLLSHTSGLKGSIEQIDNIDLSHEVTNDSIVTLLIRHQPELIFSPGSDWGYSNLGYDLLAVIVERVSRMKFSDYLMKNIFDRAGMSHTFLPNEKDPKEKLPKNISEKNLLVGHMFENIASCEVKPIDSIALWQVNKDYFVGSSNIYSTVTDLDKFDHALRKNILLSHQSQELAYTPFVLNNGDKAKDLNAPIPSYYGLGWFISIDQSWGKIIWHKGRSPGSRSVFLRNPQKKQTITFTDNYDYYACDLKGIACLKLINHQKYRNPVLMSLVQKFGCDIYDKGFETARTNFENLKSIARQDYYLSQDEMIELGNKLSADNKLKDGLSVMDFCTGLFPESSEIFTCYANILLQNNNPDKAVENYRKAILLYSQDNTERESLLNNVGYGFLVSDKINEAEFVLKLNTEIYPDSCNTYDSYASALEKNNKIELAILNQRKAITIAKRQNDKLLNTLEENLKRLESKK